MFERPLLIADAMNASLADSRKLLLTSDGALSAAYPLPSAAWQRAQYLAYNAGPSSWAVTALLAAIAGAAVGALPCDGMPSEPLRRAQAGATNHESNAQVQAARIFTRSGCGKHSKAGAMRKEGIDRDRR